ncbi:MAG: trypsin-like serine protease [Planctomycetes bacterium]|nr:trypsin-like serine protease [Planctomycetota bacterium]
MRQWMGCLLSALLGGLLAVGLVERPWEQPATAQVRGGRRGPTFPIQPAPAHPGSEATPPAPSPVPASRLFNTEGLTPEEAVNVAVYERVNKSVVNITTRSTRLDSFFLLEVPEEGTGSGSVIDKAGHILTNFHVIEDAEAVAVRLFDGKTYDASFVGADPINDIAVIKIDAAPDVLHPVIFGNSSNLRVGMRVFAIGNPFGLERTLTTGIISSLNRSMQIRANRTIKSIIQVDAAINPGNSGGPLLDAHGRLIGMNTAIASKTGQSAGVGFAIPVNLISRVVPQLLTHGHVIRPDLGIRGVYETGKGLLITQLVPNGPAERAGLRGPRIIRRRRGPFVFERIDVSAADLIIAVDGEKVETWDDLMSIVERKQPGDRVVVTVLREGRRLDVPVILGGETPSGPYRRHNI